MTIRDDLIFLISFPAIVGGNAAHKVNNNTNYKQ